MLMDYIRIKKKKNNIYTVLEFTEKLEELN